MATFYSNSNKGYRLRLDVTVASQSTANNTTTYDYTLDLEIGTTVFNGRVDEGYLNEGGSRLWTSPGSANTQSGGYNRRHRLSSGRRTVAHDNKGDKTLNLAARYSANSGGWGPVGLVLNASMALTKIARASDIGTITVSELGKQVTVSINRKHNSFTHRAWYKIKDSPWFLVGSGYTTSFSFVPPVEYAKYITDASSGAIEISIQTEEGSSKIGGEVRKRSTIKVPEVLMPTLGDIVHFESNEDVPSVMNSYIQGVSIPIASIQNSSGIHGSTIKSYKMEVDGQVFNGQTGQLLPLKSFGELTLKGTVTDTRNRSVSQSVVMKVLKYHAPTIDVSELYRSASSGKEDPLGTYLYAWVSGGVSPIYKDYEQQGCPFGSDTDCQLNQGHLEMKTRVKGSSQWTNFASGNTIPDNQSVTIPGAMKSGFRREDIYEVQITMTDMFNMHIALLEIGKGKSAMQILDDTIAIGMITNEVKHNLYVADRGMKSFGPIIDKNGNEVLGQDSSINDWLRVTMGSNNANNYNLALNTAYANYEVRLRNQVSKVGGSLSLSGDKVICNEDGTYDVNVMFQFSALSKFTSYLQPGLRVNGIRVEFTLFDPHPTNGFHTSTMFARVILKKGDKVDLVVNHGNGGVTINMYWNTGLWITRVN